MAALAMCGASCTLWGQESVPPPDSWPILLPCRDAAAPRACTDSLLEATLRGALSGSLPGGGLVVAAFTIDQEGLLGGIEILRGTESAATTVRETLESLPGWVPAFRDGLPVPVRLELPLRILHPEGLEDRYSLAWGDADTRLLDRKRLRGLAAGPMLVRDASGVMLEPVQVTWTCRRGDKVRRHRGPARNDPRLAAWLRRCPRGATLEVEARIVRETAFLPVRREWQLH